MERVTDEWLYLAESAAHLRAVKAVKDVSSAEWHKAKRLAFAQAVARECVRLANIQVATCNEQRPLDGTTPCWIDYVVANIRARFGLEE